MIRKRIKIINVVGARPNFVKIAPIIKEMDRHRADFRYYLVHTGQHFDSKMSGLFFDDLELPRPDFYLGVGSGSHAGQTARIMQRFEKVLLKIRPDIVLVVGDVNSTLACALCSVKLHIPVAHVEAGLRSFDREMPEEINRILTDAISDYLFTTERSACINLLNEGRPEDRIYFVGNVMVDTLLNHIEKARSSDILERIDLKQRQYAVLTLHRPSNVDHKEIFIGILNGLREVQKQTPIVWPIHPRTKKMLRSFRLEKMLLNMQHIKIIPPLGYLDFLRLMLDSKFILTNSGGIQEESTILGVPCLTLRRTTERPATIEEGTNVLVGTDKDVIISSALKVIQDGRYRYNRVPELWDGKAAIRIVDILRKELKG